MAHSFTLNILPEWQDARGCHKAASDEMVAEGDLKPESALTSPRRIFPSEARRRSEAVAAQW